jgi:cellulose synthase/poly-beta-1,6-N-acetylglucosamine synthase-like glycosyltransferase
VFWGTSALLVLYGVCTAALAAIGLYYALLAAERIVRTATETHTAELDDERPAVTIQVPVYNERHVIDRALRAIGDLRWPAEKLQVQIIDDSTDETTAVVEEETAALREKGVTVEHITREERTGYKAGAVETGLETATGEFVALFDADFVPPEDFLEETMPHFTDSRVGCVQTRWSHLNEDYSWFTRAQALALDAHFAVEQWVRAQVGSLMSFNATSCVWRRETLDDVGGWSSETVAEDLDLTASALLRDWEFVYTEGYAVPCEIPVTLSGFVRQQTRWARGSAQNVRKHLPDLLRTDELSRWATFHSILHVLHYVFYPLLLAWLVLHVLVTVTADVPRWLLVGGFLGTTPGPLAFLWLGQAVTDRPGRLRRLVAVVPLTLVGVGLTWRMTRAVVSGTLEMGGSFARTPKFAIDGPRRSWRGQAYASVLGNLTPEILLGAWCATGAALAVATGSFRMAPSLSFFALSFWSLAGFASWQRYAG